MDTEPRDPAPTAKRAQIQAAVLTATEDLLAESASYADLNVERIARRAGISRTAFYFYFRDKRELLMRLTGDVAEALYGEAEHWYQGEGDPADDMRTAVRNIARLYDEHFPLLRAVVEVSTYDEEVAVFWRSLLGRFGEATRVRIEGEQKGGHVDKTIPAGPTAFSLVWMTERTFYQQVVQDRPLPQDDLIDALVGIWTRALYGRLG